MTEETEFDAAEEARLQRATERYAKVLGGTGVNLGKA
jgi:hypothetical protein